MRATLVAVAMAGSIAAACATHPDLAGQESSRATANAASPLRGPLRPDLPLAGGYDEAARALSRADDNPIIRWEYRVWCETGYRGATEAGAGQNVDALIDASRDLVSPQGFFYQDLARTPMPHGGVRFLDNAWYFGADGLGVVVVRSADGLLIFDTMTTPEEFQQVVLNEMPAAGLDPADIRYIFLGHMHSDHTGGANLIQTIAPDAKVVMGAPDAEIVEQARAELRAGRMPSSSAIVSWRAHPADPQKAAELHALRLRSIPNRVDIRVPAEPGLRTGSLRIRTGARTEVMAVLNPGHTPGQMSVIVPVEHRGAVHQLLIVSGNDNPEQAAQYAISMDYLRSVAAQAGADALINTHGYQSAMFHHLRRIKADPAAPNPFLMQTDGVNRYLGIFADCQRATKHRLKDGTWLGF